LQKDIPDKEKNMNKKFFLFILAATGVVILSAFNAPKFIDFPAQQTSQVSQPGIESAVLLIDYGENNVSTYSLDVEDDTTAFSLLVKVTQKENISLETKEYDFGVFVESINGVVGTSEMAWIYFVNGRSGQIAADQQKVSPGDTVEWRYIAPNGE